MGALLIKQRLGVNDEEAVELIREKPYLQYVPGFREFRDDPPFDPSMHVHFRKRFNREQLGRINEATLRTDQGDGQSWSNLTIPGSELRDNANFCQSTVRPITTNRAVKPN